MNAGYRPSTVVGKALFFVSIVLVMSLEFGCSSSFNPIDSETDQDGTVPWEPSGVDPLAIQEIDPNSVSSDLEKNLIAQALTKVAPGSPGDATTPSLVMSLVTPEYSRVYPMGLTPQGNAPTMTDIYPLSSISKMLTGIMVAKAVSQTKFLATTPINGLLPSGSGVDPNLTVGHLLSHFGGFKSMPDNLPPGAPGSPAQNFSRQNLVDCLDNECERPNLPGQIYMYSNIGIGVLGEALLETWGHPNFQELLAREFVSDFGLQDTLLSRQISGTEREARVVQGYSRNGQMFPPARMGSLAAAGEVVSTGQDMARLLQGLVSPDRPNYLDIATRKIADVDETHAMAFAIDIDKDHNYQLFYKAGNQAAYCSFIVWSPELGVGIVLLANRSSLGPQIKDLAFSMMETIANHQ